VRNARELGLYSAQVDANRHQSEQWRQSQNCVADEQGAQQQLAKEWAQFAKSDKASCTEEVSGFEPSYVELLACLEAARDAKQVPQE
jgi:hypothetical protein